MTATPRPMGRDDVRDALTDLGVHRGDALLVHADADELSPVIGGLRAVIEGLIDAVGPRGTVAMAAFSSDALLPAVGRGVTPEDVAKAESQVLGFNPLVSTADIAGPLAETFRCWPGVERSSHPIYSLAAFGPAAHPVCAHHPRDLALGLDGPVGRLMETGAAKLLHLGTGWSRSPAMVTAETVALRRRMGVVRLKENDRRTGRWAGRWVHARDIAEDRDGFYALIGRTFEQTAMFTRGTVAGAASGLARLDDVVAYAAPRLALAVSRLERTRPPHLPDTAQELAEATAAASEEQGASSTAT
ncbi:MAG: AAC(3) family N-acetyltransferase [Pseudomonadota bacterium]